MIKTFLINFSGALSFLSRIHITCQVNEDFNQYLPWFGMAGLLISTLALLPAVLFLLFFNFSTTAIIPAFLASALWIASEALLTGALHWDGLADFADAIGSNSEDEKFWKILKDPHTGSFGALTLILTAIIQCCAASGNFFAFLQFQYLLPGKFTPLCLLALSGLWARLFPIIIAYKVKAAPESKLARHICANISFNIFFINAIQALACMGIVWIYGTRIMDICALAIAQLFLVCYFRQKEKKHGGCSGDFMGACLLLSQTNFLVFAIPRTLGV